LLIIRQLAIITPPKFTGFIGDYIVANSAQARKRIRQAEKHRQHNASQRSMMRTFLKKANTAIETSTATASEALRQASSIVDRMVNKGLIHKNKAARHKSRLNAQLKKQAAA